MDTVCASAQPGDEAQEDHVERWHSVHELHEPQEAADHDHGPDAPALDAQGPGLEEEQRGVARAFFEAPAVRQVCLGTR